MIGKVMGSRSRNPLQGLGRNGSAKRGKKSTLEKAIKQPQRGLGVAQLEKLRLESQMMASYVSPLECDPDKVSDLIMHDLMYTFSFLYINLACISFFLFY